ncbi:MAG TPA: DUF2304 domain-containing protein [Saprospiraceae bacterium]|nr:DUF2304 domain-containing protein [Saprospiraceae bacterium]
MDLRVYQIITLLTAIVLQVIIVRKFRQGSFRLPELMVSSLVLLVLLMAAINPGGFSNRLANLLGIENDINAVLFGGLVLSLWFNFRLWMLLRTLEKKFSRIITHLSILNEEGDEQDEDQ